MQSSQGIKLSWDVVDPPACGIITLKGVAQRIISGFVNGHSAAAFPAKTVRLVFDIHHFLWEAALDEVEVQAVEGNQTRKEHVLELLLPLEGIPKHKAAHYIGMSMNVNIGKQPLGGVVR